MNIYSIFYKKSQELVQESDSKALKLIPDDKKQLFLSHIASIIKNTTDLSDSLKKIDKTNLESINILNAMKPLAIRLENTYKSNTTPNVNDITNTLNDLIKNYKTLQTKVSKDIDLMKDIKDSINYIYTSLIDTNNETQP